jgi:putative transposase
MEQTSLWRSIVARSEEVRVLSAMFRGLFFLRHVLPDGFQKIRYFGLMANRGRAANLALCRMLIPNAQPGAATLEVKSWRERYRELTGENVRLCRLANEAG